MTRTLIASAAVAALAGAANASLVFEAEPNDSLATAQDLGSFAAPGGALAVDGSLTPGNVDFYNFTIENDAPLVLIYLGSNGANDLSEDGQFQLIDDTGMVIEFDDDDGVGFMPGLNLVDLGAGTYTLAVSGFDDGGVDEDTVVFDGLQDDGSPHPEDFEYKLSIAVNVIPAPGAATLAGLAGFAAIRRRR